MNKTGTGSNKGETPDDSIYLVSLRVHFIKGCIKVTSILRNSVRHISLLRFAKFR